MRHKLSGYIIIANKCLSILTIEHIRPDQSGQTGRSLPPTAAAMAILPEGANINVRRAPGAGWHGDG